jgi:hypothetical protein
MLKKSLLGTVKRRTAEHSFPPKRFTSNGWAQGGLELGWTGSGSWA